MTTSDSINELAAALAKAQAEMGDAKKDSANPFFKSRYADLSSVRDACRPMAAHGLSFVQSPQVTFSDGGEVISIPTKSGETRLAVKVLTIVSVVTRLLHSSGQWIEDTASTVLPTGDPQAVGSAVTYLRRYSLAAFAGIAPADDDAEAATVRQPQQAAPDARPKPLPVPDGYADWLDDLSATAETGLTALEAAWTASAKEYRAYLKATNPKKIDALKAIAGQVQA